jgi:hypothetical protein
MACNDKLSLLLFVFGSEVCRPPQATLIQDTSVLILDSRLEPSPFALGEAKDIETGSSHKFLMKLCWPNEIWD